MSALLSISCTLSKDFEHVVCVCVFFNVFFMFFVFFFGGGGGGGGGSSLSAGEVVKVKLLCSFTNCSVNLQGYDNRDLQTAHQAVQV